MFCNLPSGGYGSGKPGLVRADADLFQDFSAPIEYKGTAFLIYRLVVSRNAGGTVSTLYTGGSGDDLRGVSPGTGAGGSSAGTAITDFADNQLTIYNITDNTKIIDFDASSITTANTRTITMADANVDLADIALNTTHRGSAGTDHSDVGLNNTHRTSTGADHGYLNQDVQTTASPAFAGATVNGDLTIGTAESRIILNGQSSASTTGLDYPVIYNTDDDGGAYPYTTVGNLVLQSRSNSLRDIVCITGSTPIVQMKVYGDPADGKGVNITNNLEVGGDLDVTGGISSGAGFTSPLLISGDIAPYMRINCTDTSIDDLQEFGRIQWFMNDANTGGVGETAAIAAIFNDNAGGPAQQTVGEGTDLVFYTGYVNTGSTPQDVEEAGRFDKNKNLFVEGLKVASSHPSNYKEVYVDTDTGQLYRLA
jgi:hypothetical protein